MTRHSNCSRLTEPSSANAARILAAGRVRGCSMRVKSPELSGVKGVTLGEQHATLDDVAQLLDVTRRWAVRRASQPTSGTLAEAAADAAETGDQGP